MPHGAARCAPRGRAADLGRGRQALLRLARTTGWWPWSARATSRPSSRSTTATTAGSSSFCRHMLGSREEAEDARPAHLPQRPPGAGSHRRADRTCAPGSTRSPATAASRCCGRAATRSRPRTRRSRPVDRGLAVEVAASRGPARAARDLGGLPDDQRAALVLAELGDLSPRGDRRGDRRAQEQGQGARLPGARGADRRRARRATTPCDGDPRAARDRARRRAAARRRCAATCATARRAGSSARRSRRSAKSLALVAAGPRPARALQGHGPRRGAAAAVAPRVAAAAIGGSSAGGRRGAEGHRGEGGDRRGGAGGAVDARTSIGHRQRGRDRRPPAARRRTKGRPRALAAGAAAAARRPPRDKARSPGA